MGPRNRRSRQKRRVDALSSFLSALLILGAASPPCRGRRALLAWVTVSRSKYAGIRQEYILVEWKMRQECVVPAVGRVRLESYRSKQQESEKEF